MQKKKKKALGLTGWIGQVNLRRTEIALMDQETDCIRDRWCAWRLYVKSTGDQASEPPLQGEL